jgi:hypothetical protein
MSATPQTSASTIPLPVNITHTGAAPSVDNDTIIIDREQGGENLEVVWLCNAPGKTFHICFPKGSPFQQSRYTAASNLRLVHVAHSAPSLRSIHSTAWEGAMAHR